MPDRRAACPGRSRDFAAEYWRTSGLERQSSWRAPRAGYGQTNRQQRIELAGIAVAKADHKFATVRAKSLQRMRLACREIPQIALVNVRYIWPAHGVENRHAAT